LENNNQLEVKEKKMNQQDNTLQKKRSKIKIWIAIILCIVLIPAIWYVGMIVYGFSRIFHEEPYNESNTALIISRIEKNCDFKFPEKMEFLRAGGTLAAGIDRPYVCVLRFVTDQNGFDKLKQLDGWEDITEEIANGKWKDTRYFTKRAPQWYKTSLEKGRTHEYYSSGGTEKLHLHILCVELTPPERVVVYMDGWGSSWGEKNILEGK
jgi:hypothetical protein